MALFDKFYPKNKQKKKRLLGPVEAVYAGPEQMAFHLGSRTNRVYAGPEEMDGKRRDPEPMEEVYAGPPEPEEPETEETTAEETAAEPEQSDARFNLVYAGPQQLAGKVDQAMISGVYAGPQQMAAIPDLTTGPVYAGPQQMSQSAPPSVPPAGTAHAAPESEERRRLREEAEKRMEPIKIDSLKTGILSMVRYRSVSVTPEELEGKSLDELQALYDKIAEMPQTIYIDEMPLRPNIPDPSTMMVYAGPAQMANGGFLNIGMFHTSIPSWDGPGSSMPGSAGPKPVGKCPHCGGRLMSWTQFCPECCGKLDPPRLCPTCGAEVSEGQKFCHECGTRLDQQ